MLSSLLLQIVAVVGKAVISIGNTLKEEEEESSESLELADIGLCLSVPLFLAVYYIDRLSYWTVVWKPIKDDLNNSIIAC